MRNIVRLLTFALVCESTMLQADPLVRQSLFRIERNTNANIVQYDAQVGQNGIFDSKKPVVAYWIRLAEQGQVKELSWIQSKFAYGFKATLDRETDSVTLDMAADIGRLIRIQRIGEAYQATTDIDGTPSRIVKIYIHATGKGLSTRVDFIELHGTDLAAGDETLEQFIP